MKARLKSMHGLLLIEDKMIFPLLSTYGFLLSFYGIAWAWYWAIFSPIENDTTYGNYVFSVNLSLVGLALFIAATLLS